MRNTTRTALLAAIATTALATSASATLVVNLQPSANWVSADNQGSFSWTKSTGDYDGGGTANDYRYTKAFSTSSVFSPATTGGASNNWGNITSHQFYGGGSQTKYNADWASFTNPVTRLRDGASGANDSVEIGGTNAVNSGTLALLWGKNDFLNGGNSASVSLSTDNAISFTGKSINSGTYSYRWLIQKGGAFYVSNETGALDPTNYVTKTSSTLTTTTWAPVDLASDILAPVGSFGALSGGLTNIQGVGIYLTTTGVGSSNSRIQMQGFTVEAAVPEPASIALIGSASLLLAARRRSR